MEMAASVVGNSHAYLECMVCLVKLSMYLIRVGIS